MGVLQNIPRSSEKGMGGLCYALLANYDEVNVTVDQSTGETTFAVVDPSDNIADLFSKVVFTKETSNYTVEGEGTPTAGTISFNHQLTMVFARNETLKRNMVKVLGQSELVVVAVDRNGEAWCLGNDNCGGLDLTGSSGESGTGPNDLSGTTITLTGSCREPESYVTSDVLDTLQD